MKVGKFVYFEDNIGIIRSIGDIDSRSGKPILTDDGNLRKARPDEETYQYAIPAIELHFIDNDGKTKMRLDEEGAYPRPVTDNLYISNTYWNQVELLDGGDSRIPESRRRKR